MFLLIAKHHFKKGVYRTIGDSETRYFSKVGIWQFSLNNLFCIPQTLSNGVFTAFKREHAEKRVLEENGYSHIYTHL